MATSIEIQTRSNAWLAARNDAVMAEGLALESLAYCREAIEMMEMILLDLDYPVSRFITPISTNTLNTLCQKIEGHTKQPIPRILYQFWKIIGGVTFLDLENYSHESFWRKKGIEGRNHFCDGFHIDACDDNWARHVIRDYDDLLYDNEVELFQYTLAPDGYHKASISGGGPYGVAANDSWYPAWQAFWWPGFKTPSVAAEFSVMTDCAILFEGRRIANELDFLSYVRIALLECGGFPGLYGSKSFEPIRSLLVDKLPAF